MLVCPSKPRENKLFWWDIPEFLAGYPGSSEKFEKKTFVFNFQTVMRGAERVCSEEVYALACSRALMASALHFPSDSAGDAVCC